MTDPIAAHLAAVRRDRYSDATLTARARILATLPDPLGMDRLATLAWWESRQTRPDGEPRAASSLSGEKAHAAEFWRWAMREGLLDRNPADWLPKVRQAKTMAVVVPEGDLYRLLRDAAPPMRRMVALAAMAGLRAHPLRHHASRRGDGPVDPAPGPRDGRRRRPGQDAHSPPRRRDDRLLERLGGDGGSSAAFAGPG